MPEKNTTRLPYESYAQYFEYFLRQQFQSTKAQNDQAEHIPDIGRLRLHFTQHFPNQPVDEKDVFLLTLIPHINLVLLDRLFAELLGEGNFPQLGGVRGKQYRGILPTGEMALFLLAKDDPEQRRLIQQKYLSKLFDKAKHKDWILFFDEADALFGKRTEPTTAIYS